MDNFDRRPREEVSGKVNSVINEKIMDLLSWEREFAEYDLAEGKISSLPNDLCDREGLDRALYENMGRGPFSHFEYQFMSRPSIVGTGNVPPENTIYAEASLWDFKLKKVSIKRTIDGRDGKIQGCCAPIINLGGHLIGIDKIGHFFAEGHTYYQIYKSAIDSGMNERAAIKAVLKRGENLENGMQGLLTNGVYSFADLSANFAGLKFWKVLLDGDNPYIKCVMGEDGIKEYKLVRPIDMRDFVDDSWDEAINCSGYKSSMQRQIEQYLDVHKDGVRCPVEKSACHAIREKYRYFPSGQEVMASTIHPGCFNIGDSMPQEEWKIKKESGAAQ